MSQLLSVTTKTLNYIKEITTIYYENIRMIILINCHTAHSQTKI
jgi:hypothetical protein